MPVGVSNPIVRMMLFHPCTDWVMPAMEGMLITSLAASFETKMLLSMEKNSIAEISLPSVETRVSRKNWTALKATGLDSMGIAVDSVNK